MPPEKRSLRGRDLFSIPRELAPYRYESGTYVYSLVVRPRGSLVGFVAYEEISRWRETKLPVWEWNPDGGESQPPRQRLACSH